MRAPDKSTWWGRFDIPSDEGLFWKIGSLSVWLSRSGDEWRVTTESSDEVLATDEIIAVPATTEPGPEAETMRFGFRHAKTSAHLRPATADRPVVVKADPPFVVPSGEEITVFVSTALWLQLRAEASSELLYEVPLYRPSDTWFGPSTREGELCYASRTGVRFNLENVPVRPHRAVSIVRIRNRAKTQLPLERLKLPLPQLSVFAGTGGRLWTETLTLEREQDDEHAAIHTSRGAPKEAGEAKRLAEPRKPAERGLLTRAFGGLFGLKGAGSG